MRRHADDRVWGAHITGMNTTEGPTRPRRLNRSAEQRGGLWRKWCAQNGLAPAAPVAVPAPAATPSPVERTAALVTAGGVTSVSALLGAAGTVWGEGTVSDRVALALAAATELRPGTDQARLRVRLETKAAELEGTRAGS